MERRITSISIRFRRRAAAGLIAVMLHLAVLAVIGLRAPGFVARDADSRANMEIVIVPMPGLLEGRRLAPAPTRPATRIAEARPAEARAAAAPVDGPPSPIAPSVQTAAAPPAAGEGPSVGCEREVLLLLTTAERARCRNQVAADAERRARAGQAARDAETVREARAQPKVDLIPQEKRAYYDAIQTSRRELREGKGYDKVAAIKNARGGTGDPAGRASHNTNIDVGIVFPKCSIRFGPNKEKAKKVRGEIKLGPLPCRLQVPQSPFAEDAGTAEP